MTRYPARFARQGSIATVVAIWLACSHCSDDKAPAAPARIAHESTSSSHPQLPTDAALASGGESLVADSSLGAASADAGSASDASSEAAPLDADIAYTSSGRPEPSSCLRQSGSFIGPNDFGYTADWSPTNDYLLAGTMGLLRLLAVDTEAETIVEVATFKQPPVQVYAEWSPDGRYALSAGADVRLIQVVGDPPAIAEVARYTGHTDSIVAITWSPDGHTALTASKDETVRLLAVDGDRHLLEERAIFHGHVGEVFAVAWSPDGRNALSMGKDRTMRLLAVDVAAGALTELASVSDVDWETAVAWAAGDRPVLSGDWGVLNQVEMWSIDAADSKLVSKGVLTSFDLVGAQVLEWNRAGNLLTAAGHDDNVLQLFSYANRRFTGIGSLTNWQHGVHAASWSRDGNFIAIAAAYTEHVMLLDVRDCLSQALP
jgi:WD40 repeat protein